MSKSIFGSRILATGILLTFIIAFTGFIYLQTQQAEKEPEGYSQKNDYGFTYFTPDESTVLKIGITKENVTMDSGWIVAKLDGDNKQYGVIWLKQAKIPSNYTRDLSGFTSFVLERVEKTGVKFVSDEEINFPESVTHDIEGHRYMILDGKEETPVLAGTWCCEETDLCFMVYSLVDPEFYPIEELIETWDFFIGYIKCC